LADPDAKCRAAAELLLPPTLFHDSGAGFLSCKQLSMGSSCNVKGEREVEASLLHFPLSFSSFHKDNLSLALEVSATWSPFFRYEVMVEGSEKQG